MGSFFVSAFPGETVPVGISFGPLTDFLAFSHTFHLDTGDVSIPGALAEHIIGGDVLPGLDGEIIFSEQAPFFLGTTGQPASTQYDFVTFAMHELGHIFGFTSFLQPDGTYQGSPTLYDQFVGDATLKSCIKEARRAVGDTGQAQRLIQTLHGRGYRFIAPVRTLLAPGGPETEAAAGHGPAARFRRPPHFVGRDAALAQLTQWWTTACQGTRQVGVIAGVPGIG